MRKCLTGKVILPVLLVMLSLPIHADDETYVAKIGDTGYTTLAAAFAACKNAASDEDKTIVLQADVSGVTLQPAYGFILDLNSYAITGSIVINTSDPCIITDNSSGKKGKIDNDGSYSLYLYKSGANVDIQGGTITGMNSQYRVFVAAGSTLTVSGGTVRNSYGYYTSTNGNNAYAYVIYNTGTVKVTSGEVYSEGRNAVFSIGSGTVNVSGGRISADLGYAMTFYGTSTGDISGGTVQGGSSSKTGSFAILVGTSSVATATLNVSEAAKVTTNGQIAIYNYANTNVTGGSISASANYAVYNANASSKLTISGGTLDAASMTVMNNNGTCTIKGGEITGNSDVVMNNGASATCNITGGNISATSGYAVNNVQNSGLVTIDGDAVLSGMPNILLPTSPIDIKGGIFESLNAVQNNHYYGLNSKDKPQGVRVYGGKYRYLNWGVRDAVQDPDKVFTKEGDYYVLTDREEICEIDGTRFRSLESAIKAVGAGETKTIILLTNVTNGTGIAIPDEMKNQNKNITIDFNGYTYNVVSGNVGSSGSISQVMHFIYGNTLTLKNGTITFDKNGTPNIKMLMQNYCNLTLEDITIDGTKIKDITGNYCNFNSGISTIKGKTIINMDGDSYGMSLNMGGWLSNGSESYKEGASLEIDGNEVEINGKFVVLKPLGSVADGYGTNGDGLSINGGYFSNFIIEEEEDGSRKDMVEKNHKDNRIKITGGTYVENGDFITAECKIDSYCAEAYKACDHRESDILHDGNETWTVRWPLHERDDDMKYLGYVADELYHTSLDEDKPVTSVYYTRNFSKNVTDNYQCWFVPFDYEVSAYDVDDYTFYDIDEKADAVQGLDEKTVIYLTPLSLGDKLVANKPYVVKPMKVETHGFASSYGTALYAKDNSILLTKTAHGIDFNFYGVYEQTWAKENDEWLTVSIKGTSFWCYKDDDVKPYRWIVKTIDTGTGAKKKASFVFSEEPVEITGISCTADLAEGQMAVPVAYYALDGRKLSRPVSGPVIVKYSNHTSRIVNFNANTK